MITPKEALSGEILRRLQLIGGLQSKMARIQSEIDGISESIDEVVDIVLKTRIEHNDPSTPYFSSRSNLTYDYARESVTVSGEVYLGCDEYETREMTLGIDELVQTDEEIITRIDTDRAAAHAYNRQKRIDDAQNEVERTQRNLDRELERGT